MSHVQLRRRVSRRHLLRSGASIAIALPWLEAMAGSHRETSGPGVTRLGAPPRFVAILHNNGVVADDFFPAGGVEEFELPPLLEPFAPYRDQLLVLRGIDNLAAAGGPTDGHREGVVSFLTGQTPSGDWNVPGPSVDQAIADVIGADTKRRSLELGTNLASDIVSIAYDGFGQRLPIANSPRDAFEALFADFDHDPAELEAIAARRRSVLDGITDDLSALLPRVSAADRVKLEAHLDAIREVERRLDNVVGCDPTDPGFESYNFELELDRWSRDTIDLVALALSCDVTRVVTITYRHPGGGSSYFPFLGLPDGDYTYEHHEMSHAPGTHRDRLLQIERWFNEQTAALVGKLAAASEASGSVLDSTLILQGSECSDGAAHSHSDMPFLLLGSAGGQLQTGRSLQYGGASANDLLVSVMNAMGVQGNTFGDAQYCSGPLPGLT
jgi:hypothetical protein